MEITYIHHDGFAIETKNTIIIIDYFEESINEKTLLESIIDSDKTIYFLSSHRHHDHFCKTVLEYARENIIYVFSGDIGKIHSDVRSVRNMNFINKGDIYQDELIKVTAYGSTDIGISFKIDVDGESIFHAGDLNNWHWNEECDAKRSKKYEDDYLGELNYICEENNYFDIVMFPMDPRLGKDYARGATQFIEKIKVRYFIPMHFWNEFDKGSNFDDFDKNKCEFLPIKLRGQKFTL